MQIVELDAAILAGKTRFPNWLSQANHAEQFAKHREADELYAASGLHWSNSFVLDASRFDTAGPAA